VDAARQHLRQAVRLNPIYRTRITTWRSSAKTEGIRRSAAALGSVCAVGSYRSWASYARQRCILPGDEVRRNDIRTNSSLQRRNKAKSRSSNGKRKGFSQSPEVHANVQEYQNTVHFDPPSPRRGSCASLQFVRKISGFNKPSKANEAGIPGRNRRNSRRFEPLLHSLETNALPRNREEKPQKRKRAPQPSSAIEFAAHPTGCSHAAIAFHESLGSRTRRQLIIYLLFPQRKCGIFLLEPDGVMKQTSQ